MIPAAPQRHDPLVQLRAWRGLQHVSQGRTVLAMDQDGRIAPGPERGLFVHETRLLSRYRHLVDGKAPIPVALSSVAEHSWLGYYIALPEEAPRAEVDQGSGLVDEASQQTLELRLSRFVGGGLHEDVDLTNYTQRRVTCELAIEVDADFADPAETVRGRQQRGRRVRRWQDGAGDGGSGELSFRYRSSHRSVVQGHDEVASIDREVTVRVHRARSSPTYGHGRILFAVDLAPQESWHACIDVVPRIDGQRLPPVYGCAAFHPTSHPLDRARESFLAGSTRVSVPGGETLAPVVAGVIDQARRDLASLRLHDLDGGGGWTMAAGLPLYVALFGRDTLTAAWQSALLGPEMMRGTLHTLDRYQGRIADDWRDEQPGKMLHEAHTGPLSALGIHPRARYYGSITTSGFYPVALAELWHWTGDRDAIRPHVAPALAALGWLERYARRPSGFYEYQSRSVQGNKHQAWKDSSDAIVRDDGSQVPPPIATAEEQGFVYAAKQLLSETLWWLDEKDEARRLYREAEELKKRFNEAFWMEPEGFVAMGLDRKDVPIRAIGSNAGHCVATGILESERAGRCVARMMEDDLWSGWGIRTLSSRNPAYDPYSYHRGSIWPVEQGSFALGFHRYGLHREVQAICGAQFEVARLFQHLRLPEVLSGHPRDALHPFPAMYPKSNSPQAWSASAVFCMLQALLGIYPYAPLHLLLLDPHLPDWLPELTLHGLRVGAATATLRFWRRGERTEYELLAKEGKLHVLRQPSPWSLTAGFGERLRDLVESAVT